MTTMTLHDFAHGLPKAELHLHLEGTLEPELKFELARRNGIELAERTVDEVVATYDFTDLTSFLAVYYPAMQVLVTADDFRDLAYAYLTKAASQGVRHAELFFDPQAHTSRGVSFDTVITGYRRGIVEARRDLGISAELIMCFLRDFSAEYAMATLTDAIRYQDWIIGVGLDSDERGNPPEKFAAVFARARQAGFLLTMHCDIDQVGSIDNIRTVLTEIEVDRIDHGTNIVEDPALVDLAIEKGIGFTTCPISNSFVTDDMKATEIVDLLRRGAKVTVNSDDPAYFRGYIGDNYAALADRGELSPADLAQIARNSFEVSWISDRRRQELLTEVDAYFASHQ
ncbi:MAG TPA: adenosine deaminase [Candidatus Avipropionibacterium avicola]|uniref:Adenine deaminase n=1 Tax=Candidatus Avipropionibacterium avicola TaxID=2840701 RepID=A0A9D1KPL5_9ACTN|nr:adenosine deaminase [Candidatus Avipropionibacterium avicola]